ncbi:hypothetical protein KV102_08925 [Mumia sp. zg.B53]|uniref:hypothetical protein n=1 Tax=Mumia sp. zg.B53 TaxID=2855449 RepID=UPI001C6F166A|nr:hypothetical protein [Mumia sp. zg.B53]MBW9214964.1 hypothetical protein [Mumia sp. zg.B53]
MDRIGIDIATGAASCWIAPDSAAASHGATAADLRQIAGGEVMVALRVCAARADGPRYSCADPHRAEIVGLRDEDTDRAGASRVCQERAEVYAGRAFDGTDTALTSEAVTWGNEAIECSVSTRRPVVGSVRDIGDGELPGRGA